MMYLLINKENGAILCASNVALSPKHHWQSVIEIEGDAEQNPDSSAWFFAWPHPKGPTSCIWDGTAIIANPAVPAPAQRLDPRDFWKLFTTTEQLAILNSTSDTIRLLHADLQTVRYVEQGHADTEAGIDALVSVGLLTAERATRVRAFLAPEA